MSRKSTLGTFMFLCECSLSLFNPKYHAPVFNYLITSSMYLFFTAVSLILTIKPCQIPVFKHNMAPLLKAVDLMNSLALNTCTKLQSNWHLCWRSGQSLCVCKDRYLALALQSSWDTARRGDGGSCQRTDRLHKSGTGPAEAASVWTADLIEGCLRRLLG